MNFEQYYEKLPGFIKYNRFMFNFASNLAHKLRKLNKSSKQLDSQSQLLNILFTHCDVKVKGSHRDLQLLYLELLRFIDNVCNKYDIDYWIDYGTLLGAVRHGGFIPWDDDIDISMMRKDYRKLIEVLPSEIKKYPKFMENCGLTLLMGGNKNYFEDFQSVYDVEDDNHILNEAKFHFLQIAWLKPYVKIDIFPKDYIDENQFELFTKNYGIVSYKFNKEISDNENLNLFEEIDSRKRQICQTNDKTNYCASAIDYHVNALSKIFRIDDIFPLNTIEFDKYVFKCPNNPHNTLKTQYGKNFMSIPNIIENHDVLEFIEYQFESKEKMDWSFKDAIDYLKEVNDNF